MRGLLVAVLLSTVVSTASNAEAQTDDPWLGPDKAMHFGVSAGLAAGGYALGAVFWEDYAPRLLLGAGIALTLGIAKELADLAGLGNASWKDMAWNVIGIATGLLLAVLVDLLVRELRREPEPTALGSPGSLWNFAF